MLKKQVWDSSCQHGQAVQYICMYIKRYIYIYIFFLHDELETSGSYVPPSLSDWRYRQSYQPKGGTGSLWRFRIFSHLEQQNLLSLPVCVYLYVYIYIYIMCIYIYIHIYIYMYCTFLYHIISWNTFIIFPFWSSRCPDFSLCITKVWTSTSLSLGSHQDG